MWHDWQVVFTEKSSAVLPTLLRRQTVWHTSPHSLSGIKVGLIRGWLELHGGYAHHELPLSNLFAYSLARQRSCAPLWLSPFRWLSATDHQLLRKRRAHKASFASLLMILSRILAGNN